MDPLPCFSFHPAAVLRISGEDHADFLQNQGTADLRAPQPSAHYTLWLDHKGLIHGDAFVLRLDPDSCLLVSHGTPASDLIDAFDRHIIADDVEIRDESQAWKVTALAGEAGRAWLEGQGEPPGENGCWPGEGWISYPGRRLGRACIELLLPTGMDLPFASGDLSAGEAEAFRLRDGIPSVPLDIPPGCLNPIEARFESPLSFTKGCYLGQEVVARVHRLQRFRQRLVRIDSYDTEIVPGCTLQLEGKEVGSVTSVARSGQGWLGMARLRSSVPAGKHDFEGLEVTVQELKAS